MKICKDCNGELKQIERKDRPGKLKSYCSTCANKKSKDRYLLNKDKRLKQIEEQRKRRRADDPEKFRSKANESHRGWCSRNKDRVRGYNQKYRDPIAAVNRVREWRNRNPEQTKFHSRFYGAKRRAAQMNATPKWANMEIIKGIYKNKPEGMEVDHIHPLQGENFCGLHVEWNLQYLEISKNRSKHNRLIYV